MARDDGLASRHDRPKERAMSARTDRGGRDPAERALRVEVGHVVCPRRGLVDIQECWSCPEYRGLSDGRVESLMCGLTGETLASMLWAVDRGPGTDRG
jgi:hypothetical protein